MLVLLHYDGDIMLKHRHSNVDVEVGRETTKKNTNRFVMGSIGVAAR